MIRPWIGFEAGDADSLGLASSADILFFGGGAGSLKTETMLVEAARECSNPNLRAIIFRQQFTQMTDIVDKTMRLYKPLGATTALEIVRIVRLLNIRLQAVGSAERGGLVRNMLSRLSSTDKHLRLRMRLASNPGSIGAAWHKTMFLRGACPVHNTEKSVVAGKTLVGRMLAVRWLPLVDEQGNGFSVALIPGRNPPSPRVRNRTSNFRTQRTLSPNSPLPVSA